MRRKRDVEIRGWTKLRLDSRRGERPAVDLALSAQLAVPSPFAAPTLLAHDACRGVNLLSLGHTSWRRAIASVGRVTDGVIGYFPSIPISDAAVTTSSDSPTTLRVRVSSLWTAGQIITRMHSIVLQPARFHAMFVYVIDNERTAYRPHANFSVRSLAPALQQLGRLLIVVRLDRALVAQLVPILVVHAVASG